MIRTIIPNGETSRIGALITKRFIYHNGKLFWNLRPFYVPFYFTFARPKIHYINLFK